MADENNVPEAEVVEGEGVEEDQAAAAVAVAVRAPAASVAPSVDSGELVKRLDSIRKTQEDAMVMDVDYGVIPGTNKPALLKPGAEKLGVLFQLDIQIAADKRWGPGDHLTVSSKATVYHAPTGVRLGFGEGLCSTRERKYGIRRKNRKCPKCGEEAVLHSKDGGWFCWRKKNGCGANFEENDQSITSQEEGEKENPDLADTWNTVVKMAAKRARIDAVLAVTGASALFTQDVEEQHQAQAAAEAPVVEMPQWSLPGDEKLIERTGRAMNWLLGEEYGPASWAKIREKLGLEEGEVMPSGVVLALGLVISDYKRVFEQGGEGQSTGPAGAEPVEGEVVSDG